MHGPPSLTKSFQMHGLHLVQWGGSMVLGKVSTPGRPTNLDNNTARAFCACSRCRWGFCELFSLVYHFSSPSLWKTVRYRLKYCLKGPLSPKTTNQYT